MTTALARQLKKLPDTPGVYFFRRGKDILYIGKATSLKDRVTSYFRSDIEVSRGGKIKQLLALITNVTFQTTASVLEALLLENQLIKKHQPKYNTREKDDKSYLYVVITKEPWPRVLTKRGKDLINQSSAPYQKIFGPFPFGQELRRALKIIRKIFPFRDYCEPGVGRPCFNAQIGLCPGVCAGKISRPDYERSIRQLILFFSGRRLVLLRELEKEMKQAAKEQNFELAASWRNRLFALQHIRDVSLISDRSLLTNNRKERWEAYDVAHLAGTRVVGGMVVSVGGELDRSNYRRFRLAQGNNDLANLTELLSRRFKHQEWPLPDLIVVDGGLTHLKTVKGLIKSFDFAMAGKVIKIVAVTKDKHHRPKAVIGDKPDSPQLLKAIVNLNAEAHRFVINYHRKSYPHLTTI